MQSKSYIEEFKESFPDAGKLTDIQRRNLLRMLNNALIEIRSLGFQGKSEQAGHLSDAFHNLPLWLDMKVFSFSHFKMFLESYQRKYPEGFYNYLELLDKTIRDENLVSFND